MGKGTCCQVWALEPTCWTKSYKVHGVKCLGQVRLCQCGHQKRRCSNLGKILSSSFQLRALGHVRTQNSHFALQVIIGIQLSEQIGEAHLETCLSAWCTEFPILRHNLCDSFAPCRVIGMPSSYMAVLESHCLSPQECESTSHSKELPLMWAWPSLLVFSEIASLVGKQWQQEASSSLECWMGNKLVWI